MTSPSKAEREPIERETLRADEVAALLDVDRKTVYECAERGKIPGLIRIGRCVRFSRVVVLAWVRQGAPSKG